MKHKILPWTNRKCPILFAIKYLIKNSKNWTNEPLLHIENEYQASLYSQMQFFIYLIYILNSTLSFVFFFTNDARNFNITR